MLTQIEMQRKKDVSTQPDEVESLDENEQQRVIEELRHKAREQASQTFTMFFFLYVCISLGFAGYFGLTVMSPWQLEHQAVLKDLVAIEAFEGFYLVSSVIMAVLAFIMKRSTVKPLDRTKEFSVLYTLSALAAGFWFWKFYTLSVTNPVLYWLPLANVSLVSLAVYIRHDMRTLLQEVGGLEQSKYEFKKI